MGGATCLTQPPPRTLPPGGVFAFVGEIHYIYRKNRMIPEFQAYIDKAWQEHAEELARLNGALEVRHWLNGIIAQHEARLLELAEEASQALPWGPEVEAGESRA